MSSSIDTSLEDNINPSDSAEDLHHIQGFSFNRTNRDELFVVAKGKYGDYRMMFVWDEEFGALQFGCEYDVQISETNMLTAGQTILDINSNLWLGHFDLPRNSLVPTYRYTHLFRGLSNLSGAEHLQNLITIAIDTCDKFYLAFMMMAKEEASEEHELVLAVAEPVGRA